MLFSMTGFGESDYENDLFRIAFRIRSVNNKGLDLQLKLPFELTYLEGEFRKVAKDKIFRGRIDVFLEFEIKDPSLTPPVDIDRARLSQIFHIADEMLASKRVTGNLDINTLIRLPDLVIEKKMGFKFPEKMERQILATFADAFDRLKESRANEGRHLLEDLDDRLCNMKLELKKITEFAASRHEDLRTVLIKRIESLGTDIQVDENRLAQELVFYADRLDISEEIIRLGAHLQTMEEKLHSLNQPKGRELEFLLQEKFREITTIGNKVKLLDAANIVVSLKTESEKIKEQVLNVE